MKFTRSDGRHYIKASVLEKFVSTLLSELVRRDQAVQKILHELFETVSLAVRLGLPFRGNDYKDGRDRGGAFFRLP